MMDSPEYNTLMQCYPKFVACVEQSPGNVADTLIPIGIFAPGDLSFLDNPNNNEDQKARRIIKVTKSQVQINPQVFHKVVSALEACGSWAKGIVSELKNTHLSLSGAREQASPKRADDKTPARDPSNQPTTKHVGLDITEKTLKQETTRMCRKFNSLVRNVISSIKASGATAKDLTMFLQQIQSVNAGILATRQSCSLFTPGLLHKIETECSDIDGVFEILKSYYSWFNFELIKCIMKKFCHKDVRVKEKLSDYETHMNRYSKNKLCRFPDSSNGFGEHRADTRPYVFKVDEQWTEMRFSELDEIIMTICDVLKLRKAVLFLQAVGGSNDCVELTFDLPEHVIDTVFPLREDQVEALKEQGVQYCGSDKSLPDSVSQRDLPVTPDLVPPKQAMISLLVSEQTDSHGIADTAESTYLLSQNTVRTDLDMSQLPPQDPATASRALIRQPSASELSDESHSSQPPALASSQSDTGSSTTSSKQQLSYLRFECGCGQCTVYSYISGKVCPNPKELPFPKLEISQIPPEEIEYIEQDFCRQSVSICRRFYGLVCDTFKNLRERVNESELMSYIKLALKPKWYLQNAVYASGSLSKFENVSPCDLPEYLIDRNCCSWFDYDLIEDLRRQYLFPNEDKPLSDYKKHFECYVSQRCFIYLHDTGPWPKNQVLVKCKVDLKYGSLSQKLIKHLKYVFTKAIGAPAYHLAFKTAREGCTELIFGAPPYFSELAKLAKYQVAQLEDHGFIKVTICGQLLFQSRTYEGSGNVSEVSDDESSLVADGYLHDSLSSIKTDSGSVPEADVDTTDNELTCIETEQEVSYSKIISVICKEDLNFEGEMELKVPPCTFWKVSHDGHPHMALVYNGPVGDKLQFSEFANDMLNEKRNILKASCVHLDDKLSHPVHLDDKLSHPILLFECEQSLRNFCGSCKVISELEQLYILRDITVAVSNLSLLSRARIKVTLETIFVHKDNDGKIKALFSPLYQYSYFPQMEQTPEPPADYEWVRDALLLMHYRDQYNEHSELPESHILYNITKYKWFSDDKSFHPKDVAEVAKEIAYILDLEKTRLRLIADLNSSDLLEVSHLHMLLLGHTGVGKTSIRKHLQNIPFNEKEKSTIIMEQELLCQSTMEASTNSSSLVFCNSENVYKSESDKVFLTLWDTGGQPMFQDLLSCFAKLRSVYGIVFRICDLLENPKAMIRPVCSLECERESPYTCIDHIYRSFAFLDSISSGLFHAFSNLPTEVKTSLFQSTELHNFPKLALIGTFKDTVREDELRLGEKYLQLKESLESFQFNFPDKALLPVLAKSVIFEIDNTRSGQKYKDPGMIDLRKQIVDCTQMAKAKIPSEWISFKINLEHESQIQQPCTGIVTFEKAAEIARQHKVDPMSALCYFHELGIFLWYRENESLKEYVIIEPKNLVSILGTVLNPERFIKTPKQWKQLLTKGIISTQLGNQLLDESRSGLSLRWIFSFFEENRLSIPLDEGYFIPSMLQVVPICPNYLHVYDHASSVCTYLCSNTESDIGAAPLFLVPKYKCTCIPPGFFPRLMTVLAGIQGGEIVWKLSFDSKNCKNIVFFLVNDQVGVECNEFFHCVRIRLTSLPGKEVSRELCRGILSQLRVQVQRVFPQANGSPVMITFACFCSNTPHFLSSLPRTTEDEVFCNKQQLELTEAHRIWIKDPTPKTNKDANKLFEEALRKGSVTLKILNVLFVGSIKEMILASETNSSNYYIVDKYEVRKLQPDHLESFFANNAAFPLSPTSDFPSTIPLIDQPEKMANVHESQPLTSNNSEVISKSTHLLAQPETTTIRKEDQIVTSNSPKVANYEVTTALEPPSSDISTEQPKSKNVGNTLSNKGATQKHGLIKEVSNVSAKIDQAEILKLMCDDSGEQHHLDLFHIIESDKRVILKLLPLFLPQISVGLIGTNQIKILEEILHISDKWIIVQVENDKMINTDDIITKIADPIKHKLLRENKESDILFATYTAKKRLIKLSSKADKKVVPYAWYYLCFCIQKTFRETNRKVISYREVSSFCHRYRISSVDLKTVLNHLHESGLLVFFEDALPSLIFEDISVLINILKSVIRNVALTSKPSIASEDDFKQVEDVYVDDVFTYLNVIELFKGLCLMLPIDKRSFFIPFLHEKCLNRKQLSQFCKQGSNSPFLVIQYSMTDEIFGSLVCFVTSDHNSDLWPWKLCISKSTGEPTCLFKNCVQYTLPGYGCIITLFNSGSFLELHIEYLDIQPPLGAIRRAILAGLEKAHTSFHFKKAFNYAVAFFCTCGSIGKEHLVIFSDEKEQWVCSENLEFTFTPSHHQKMWFDDDICPEDDSITVNSVYKALLPQSHIWFKVGIDLGLDTNTLSHISVEKSSADVALMKVVRLWLNTSPNPSWESIDPLLSKEDPLSSYPSVKQLSQLQVDKWAELGLELGLTRDELKPMGKKQQPTASTLLAAKIKNMEIKWKDIIIGLLRIGEYKVIEELWPGQASSVEGSDICLLNLACTYGHLEIAKLLIANRNCSVNDSLLHAAKYCHRSEAEFLLNECHADPNVTDDENRTPLALTADAKISSLLLKHGAKADNVYKAHGKYIGKFSSKQSLDNPVHIFIIGNGGVGKSTFLKSMLSSKGRFTAFFSKSKPVTGVDEKTVGITPYEIETKEFGRVTLYDFSGQREFYASHCAILENAVRTSPPIIIYITDLQESEQKTCDSMLWWMVMVQNQCTNLEDKAHVIVIGSHADILRERYTDPHARHKEMMFKPILKKFPRLEFTAFVPMDCRYPDTYEMKEAKKLIQTSSAVLRSPETVSLNAHAFYIYLLDSFKDKLAVSLKDVKQQIHQDLDQAQSKQAKNLLSFIPSTLPRLVEICDQLNSKGHILYLHNMEHPDRSFIICDRVILLSKVTGTVFAPENFRQHCDLSSSTGVVPLSKFSREFASYDSEMLITFMSYLELCFEISDKQVLDALTKQEQSPENDSRYLFFPALIRIETPEKVWEEDWTMSCHFGWIIECSQDIEFFDPRCLQVLILRLVFTFGLAPARKVRDHLPSLQRFCSVWKNGIFWCNDNGIDSHLGLSDDGKSLVLKMRSRVLKPEFLIVRSQIITKVLETVRYFSPNITTVESVIKPQEVVQYPLKPSSDLSLCSISDVASSVTLNQEDVKCEFGALALSQLLQFEPYAGLDQNTLQCIHSEKNTKKNEKISEGFIAHFASQVSDSDRIGMYTSILQRHHQDVPASQSPGSSRRELVDTLKTWRDKTEGTYSCLRETLNEYSIFTGRNPLDLAGVVHSEVDPSIFSEPPPEDYQQKPAQYKYYHPIADHHAQLLELYQKFYLSEDDLDKEVSNEHILEIYPQLENWKRVAAHLGLTPVDVEAIDSGARPDKKLMNLNMLQKWKSKKMLDGTDTYRALLNALIQSDCTESAHQVCQLLA